MTDEKLLRAKIDEAGLKLKYVAEQLGLSSYGLQLKLSNKSEFKTTEVAALCRILNITSLEEKESIFFAQKDD